VRVVFVALGPPPESHAIPEFFWELSLSIYCIVKGFRPSPSSAWNLQRRWPLRAERFGTKL
jgi:hypothetical protein